jgi:hypothetical protein
MRQFLDQMVAPQERANRIADHERQFKARLEKDEYAFPS